MENKRNMQVLLHKIEADNSTTLQQGEGCVLKYSLGRKSSCLVLSCLVNGTVQNAENCSRVESVTLCKAESDNIVTGTEGGDQGEEQGQVQEQGRGQGRG